MAPFQRGIRIFTAPIEATFPYTLSEKYPLPDDQTFKSLSVEKFYVHFVDTTPMMEIFFPKGMRNFGKGDGKVHLRQFDAGLRFPDHDPWRCLNFHLSYDIEKHVLDGYVDYLPSPPETKIAFIELEYCFSFSPKELPS
jgi:hypothetical protein